MYGMHGFVSVVHAMVDSTGEFVEGGVRIASKSSPRRVGIEKVQTELRLEYDVREERKRELEFLENGGNPLDFKLGNAASVSVQSTSFTDQNPDLYTTSNPKVSFAFSASPCGDSVESSDRPGPPHCGPIKADNAMSFDGEHELFEGDRSSLRPSTIHIVPSEQSFQMDGTHKATVLEDSAVLDLPKKAYKRRYRSRRNREGTKSISTDINPTCGSYGSLLPSHHALWDHKELASGSKTHDLPSNGNSESASPIGGTRSTFLVLPDRQQNVELDGANAVESTDDLIKAASVYGSSDNTASENLLVDQHNQVLSGSAIMPPTHMECDQPEAVHPIKETTSSIVKCQPQAISVNQSSSCQINGYSCSKGPALEYNADKSAPGATSGLHSDLSCSQSSSTIDDKRIGEISAEMKILGSSWNLKNKKLLSDGATVIDDDPAMETEAIESVSACQHQKKNGFALQRVEELNQIGSTLANEAVNQFNMERAGDSGSTKSESGRGLAVLLHDNSSTKKETSFVIEPQNFTDISAPYFAGFSSSTKVLHASLESQASSAPKSKQGSGNDEDSILKEAQIIEAKRKRIKDLSGVSSPVKIRSLSQWNYVLEEMSWLANDFAQERIWKIAAAAQICHRATLSSQLRKQERSSDMEAKKIAHTSAKAVLDFWHSVKDSSNELRQQSQINGALSIVSYAASFLKCNSNVLQNQIEVHFVPDISGSGIVYSPWDDNMTEENLFYTIPPRAMEMYRRSIECHVTHSERLGSSMQEEVETSECDAAIGKYGDRSAYGMEIVFEGGDKFTRFGQKRKKRSMHTHDARTCEISSNILGMEYPDIKIVTQQPVLPLKRRCGSLNASIPTKRVRTAPRRIISPFSAGTSGCMVGHNKTDGSSGDTSSFQDDQSTLHGGSLVPNSLEGDFVEEFEKQLPFDADEVSTKLKKKPKHLNALYKQKWPVDSIYEQRGHWKKGSDVYQLESNGSDGLLGQPMIKRLKMRQSQDSCFDNNIAPVAGSVTSPVASQTSNMSNANKTVKVIGGRDRDRSRKPKVLKIPAKESGSGSLWSLFEDQALVVLVHDLGPNWELISDAINDTLHFKRVFRKPKDCKEHHHVLMDGTPGDGADSAEDSGSSQPYPSKLHGIPKGSARQLFQRLQDPMDEDTLNSHFDKIIMLGQKHHNRKTQDSKRQQPHSSHATALSQVCPNNLNGGLVLTPLDFYEDTLDMPSFGHQRPNSSMLMNPNLGVVTPIPPASDNDSAFQGSSTITLNSSFPSSSSCFNSAFRDDRYGVPRSSSLTIDEQQRMYQYGQMISGRNISQQNITFPGNLPGTDHGIHVRPRMPTVRSGIHGIVSSPMLNSGSMVSPVMASANMHPGLGSGSSLTRPSESPHMMRPAMSEDSQRQIMVPDLQMQASPGNGQVMSLFSGARSPYPNQISSPPVSSYPLHHQQSHPISPQPHQVVSPRHPHFQAPVGYPHNSRQAYALHLAKERQHFLHQQPPFAASNSLASPVQSQSQLPITASPKCNFQVQSQTSSTPMPVSPLKPVSSINSMMQHQQHHTPIQVNDHNAQTSDNGLTNQMGRQRQRQQQQFSQSNRQHPQQRQKLQSHQQAKILNGAGRVKPAVHQAISTDPLLSDGILTNSGNQCLEKGESAATLNPSQSLYTSSTQDSVHSKRQHISSQHCNQPPSQQKSYSCQTSSSSKHHQQITSKSDASNHGRVSSGALTGLSAMQRSVPPVTVAGANHHQVTSHQMLVSQNQTSIRTAVCSTDPINSDASSQQKSGELNTGQHPASFSSVMNMTNSSDLNSDKNFSTVPAAVTSSSEPVLQTVQGLGERLLPANFSPCKNDVSVHWQQQPSHFLQSQQSVPSAQQPPPQQQQQQPILPLHSQQQAKLLQAGSGNLYGRPSDTRM